MPAKRHSAEQIVRKLREAEVELARGATVKDACRKLRNHRAHLLPVARRVRGLKLSQAKRLKQLEKENARLKKIVAEKELDLSILKRSCGGKRLSPALVAEMRLSMFGRGWAFPSDERAGC